MTETNLPPDAERQSPPPGEISESALGEQNRALLLKIGLPALAVFVIAIWAVSQLSSPVDDTSSRQASGSTDSTAVHANDETEGQELDALGDIRRRRVLRLADDAREKLAELQAEMTHWNTSVVTLLQSEPGRRIAADESFVVAFSAILNKERANAKHVKRYREDIEQLIAPVETSDFDRKPHPKLLGELTAVQDAIEGDLSKYVADRESVEAMLAAAEAAGLQAETSLEDAIAQKERKTARKHAEKIRRETEAARDYEGQVEAETQAEQIRRRADSRAEQMRKRAALEEQAIAEQTRRAEEEANRNTLMSRANDPAVRAKYAPFLTRSRTRVDFFKNETPQPVSVHRIENLGAHIDYKAFARVGAGHNGKTGSRRGRHGRPTWPYPQTEQEFEKYKPMFDEFWELVPIWVQSGDLLP